MEIQIKDLNDKLTASNLEITRLKKEMDNNIDTLARLQTGASAKIKELNKANDSIADLKLKLSTLEGQLEVAGGQRKVLMAEQEKVKVSLTDTEHSFTQ